MPIGKRKKKLIPLFIFLSSLGYVKGKKRKKEGRQIGKKRDLNDNTIWPPFPTPQVKFPDQPFQNTQKINELKVRRIRL